MTKTVDFLFDVGSPTTYLAYTQLPQIAADAGATIQWVPILLGAVFKATGNASPAAVPAKGAYMGQDMARFAARYRVPFNRNPFFPINTTTMMRAATALNPQPDQLRRYLDAVFDAMWVKGLNMGDSVILRETLAQAGLDAETLIARAESDEIKAKLRANTDAAITRGVFGAPTFFVGNEMFFGQDRLEFVAGALSN
jgi:2-hydroxychromene-2-carboxylate isomerase